MERTRARANCFRVSELNLSHWRESAGTRIISRLIEITLCAVWLASGYANTGFIVNNLLILSEAGISEHFKLSLERDARVSKISRFSLTTNDIVVGVDIAAFGINFTREI